MKACASRWAMTNTRVTVAIALIGTGPESPAMRMLKAAGKEASIAAHSEVNHPP